MQELKNIINQNMVHRNLKHDDIPKIEEIKIDSSKIIASIHSSNTLIDNNNKEVDIAYINYLQILEQGENGKYQLPIYEEFLHDDGWKKFNNFTYSLGKINRLSEGIYDKTKRAINICYSLKQIKSNPKYKEKQNPDFSLSQKILDSILENNKDFDIIRGIENNDDKKNFSKIFKEYIKRRNYYTHGILYFLYPSKEPILRIVKNNKETYIKYKKEDFKHNLKIFIYLKNILDDMVQVIQFNAMK